MIWIYIYITAGDAILGIDENLQWNKHNQAICKKLSTYIWLLATICKFLSVDQRIICVILSGVINPGIIFLK